MKGLKSKLVAEFVGSYWLGFGGCGSAVLAAKFLTMEGDSPLKRGIGLVGGFLPLASRC